MGTNIVTCEHGLRSRAVVCEPCRTKRKAQQQPTREQLLARISELETALTLLADEENWIQDDHADYHWAYWEPDGSDTWPQEIARAALAGA